MARQVLPIVGAVIGAFYGNPGLGYAIGSAAGPSVVPEVVEEEPQPIGAVFGGEEVAALVYPSGGADEPA